MKKGRRDYVKEREREGERSDDLVLLFRAKCACTSAADREGGVSVQGARRFEPTCSARVHIGNEEVTASACECDCRARKNKKKKRLSFHGDLCIGEHSIYDQRERRGGGA